MGSLDLFVLVLEYWLSSGQLQHGGSCLWSLPLWTLLHSHLFLYWGEPVFPLLSLLFTNYFPNRTPLPASFSKPTRVFNYSFFNFRHWTMTHFPPITVSGKIDPSWNGTTSRCVCGWSPWTWISIHQNLLPEVWTEHSCSIWTVRNSRLVVMKKLDESINVLWSLVNPDITIPFFHVNVSFCGNLWSKRRKYGQPWPRKLIIYYFKWGKYQRFFRWSQTFGSLWSFSYMRPGSLRVLHSLLADSSIALFRTDLWWILIILPICTERNISQFSKCSLVDKVCNGNALNYLRMFLHVFAIAWHFNNPYIFYGWSINLSVIILMTLSLSYLFGLNHLCCQPRSQFNLLQLLEM